ncbi:hypothetical protein P8936_02180 [Edaphobacter paludis]|uniref:Uncharacterized protein n=1 Tax=Edaphobacter paludis TaxID=3035702 RepID=A0AAU7CZX9_9BACT
MRSLIDFVSESFIWGVGITRPQPSQRRRAALYITAILMGTVVAAVAFFFLFVGRI